MIEYKQYTDSNFWVEFHYHKYSNYGRNVNNASFTNGTSYKINSIEYTEKTPEFIKAFNKAVLWDTLKQ